MKLFPYIPHRRMGQYKLEPQVKILEKHRWKVERGISWLQRKYRRLVVRWERKLEYRRVHHLHIMPLAIMQILFLFED